MITLFCILKGGATLINVFLTFNVKALQRETLFYTGKFNGKCGFVHVNGTFIFYENDFVKAPKPVMIFSIWKFSLQN
jgi:hypothetical protein